MSKEENQLVKDLINEKFSTLLESVDAMVTRKLDPVVKDVREIKQDAHTIKETVKGASQELHQLVTKVSQLKAV